MEALGQGRVTFRAAVGGKWRECYMDNVLYVPEARRNLFSVTAALDKGMDFSSTKEMCSFTKDGVVRAVGTRTGQLFKMNIDITVTKKPEINLAENEKMQIWHERFGHQNKRHVQQVLRKYGIEVVPDEGFCGACVEGKQHRLKFESRSQRATRSGEVIHADVCGPMEQKSLGGSRYFVCFTDDFSRYRLVYFLKEKSEVVGKISECLDFVENQTGKRIKEFLSDGGSEFDNNEVKMLLKSKGIQFKRTNPYTPEQNGCAERTNRTVVELARTMLITKDLPKYLWAEGVNTAVYILNQTGPTGVKEKTPSELFTGKTVRIDNLHIFGTPCYIHVPKEKRQKWDAKGQLGTLVGYSDDIDGYRVWLKNERKIVRSRNVVFQPEEIVKSVTVVSMDNARDPEKMQELEIDRQTEPEKRTLRNRDKIKAPERLIEVMTAEVDEPHSYAEAMRSENNDKWQTAMDEEMDSLIENNTWTLVTLPEGRKTVSNRWVYRVKYNADGAINRYKARLVVRGYSQREGIDYDETFSPVARFDTIRALLSVAANNKLSLSQFDVKTAFLNGILEEEIYMDQPEGYGDDSGLVCKLDKSLYGLKQSPRCWNRRFTEVLEAFGMQESTADPCLFFNNANGQKLLVALYVDDGLVAASDRKLLDTFLERLKKEFKITVNPVGCFLNIQIKQFDDGSVFINQERYANSVLKRFSMTDANAVSTPIERGIDSGEVVDGTRPINAPYREAVGSLMYLAVVTRPDLAFAVSYVSQFLDKAGELHWTLVKRILKYIKGSAKWGILYRPDEQTDILEAYSDADYASDSATRRSVSGTVFKYSGGAISWTSRRQQSVALSTTEAEYMAASEATKDIVWLSRLYGDIIPSLKTPILRVDNSSAIRLVKNPEFHRRSKHIDIRYHFVREKFNEGQLLISHVPSEDQVADILTKATPRVRFEKLRLSLGMICD